MSDHWHKQYHGDILNSYAGLPVDLRGVAYTLLDLIYDRGGPVAESDSMLAARMCCSLKMWKSYKRRLIEAGKIALTRDGHITNSRAENELKTRQKLSEFGARGGRKKAENAKIRQSFKDGDLARLDEPYLAEGLALDARGRGRGDSNESPSEAKASGADAPDFDPKKFCFDTIAGAFVSAGASEQHGRSIAGKLWNKHPDAVETVLAEMLANPPANPSSWFGDVFKRLAREAKATPAENPQTREIVYDAAGNPTGVRDLTTGTVKPLGRAA